MLDQFLQGVGVGNIFQLFLTPGRLYFALNLLYVRVLDRWKGTDFSGGRGGRLLQKEIGISINRGNDYSPTPRCLLRTLRKLYITPEDKIMDLGCGKGLAMYYMSKFPFSQIGGIELSRKLALEAKSNLNIISGNKRRYRIIRADAGKWDHYDEYTFFFIYNSFPKQVIKEVIDKINASVESKPRKVIILYLYPEFPEEITKDKKFVLVRKGSKKEIREGMHIYINSGYKNEKIFLE